MADVVVVGGGIAGLATALSLAEHGVCTIVLEPQMYAIDKPCGEGIMPAGVAHLQRLNVYPYLDVQQITPFYGVSVINRAGKQAVIRCFSDKPGLGCRRLALSQAFYRCVQHVPAIDLWRGIKAQKIEQKQSRWLISTSEGKISTRLIIGADGLRSSVRKWSGLEIVEKSSLRYGMRRHFALQPWADHVLVYIRPGIEAYVTPCGPQQINLAFLWRKHSYAGVDHKPSFDHMLALFPELAQRIHNQQPRSAIKAIGPLEQKASSPVSEGIALVGDASGYLDACTGEGISSAMAHAQALAPVVKQALHNASDGMLTRAALAPYAQAHQRIMRSYYRTTRAVLWLSRHPRIFETLVSCTASMQTLGNKHPQKPVNHC